MAHQQTPAPTSPACPPQNSESSAERWNAIACAGLFLLILTVFARALGNDFINYDDPIYITENPHLQGGLTLGNVLWAFGAGYAGNWHPLTWLSHMLDCQWFGLKPWGHHLTGIVLHAANTALVFLFLRRATGAKWPSVFVAAIFGLHPLHVESAVWAAERKDVLSTFFWMLTLLAYVSYAKAGAFPARKDDPEALADARSSYVLALVFFALGLMSKPMLVTLPFVLLLLDYWPLGRFATAGGRFTGTSVRRLLVEKLPFFALAAAASTITYFVQKHAGAMNSGKSHPFPLRLENTVISYCRYLGKLFVPENFAVFYPYPNAWPLAAVIPAAALLIAVTVLVIVHGRRHPYLPVGWFWYLGTLVPVIGLVQVGAQSLADRYTYIPILGILVLCAWGLNELTLRWPRRKVALTGVALISLLVCVPVTIRQIGLWKDSETLFRHLLAVTENNFIGHLNLGVILAKQGKIDEAANELQTALVLGPDQSLPHINLAKIYVAKGQVQDALSHFRAALAIQPDISEARFSVAELLAKEGHFDEAAGELHGEIAMDPADANAHILLASILRRQGKLDEAIGEYQAVLASSPGNFDAHNNLGIALYQKGDLDQAVEQFRAAVSLQPALPDGHSNLGLALTSQGKAEDAIGEYREVLRLQPGSPLAQKKLKALIEGGKPPAKP